MTLAERIEGAKLTDEGIDTICETWVGSVATVDDYAAIAQAQHAKDKSELLWGVKEWLEDEWHVGVSGVVLAKLLSNSISSLDIPKPEWAS